MTKKIVSIVLVAVFIGTILAGVAVIQARDLEIVYPNIPLIQPPATVKTLLPDYIKYVIVLSIIVSGLIVFGSLLYAGFLYMTSSGNPSALKNSKDRMLSSFLGIIILLSSYLILNTINPSLIKLEIGSIDLSLEGYGVVFIGTGGEYRTITDVSDFEDTGVIPSSVKFLSLDVEVIPCSEKDNFKKSNCEDRYPTPITPFTSLSFPGTAKAAKLIWKTPGVYLYDWTNYRGELKVYNASQGALSNFNDKAESINFLHPKPLFESDNRSFGAVLHENEGFKGTCEFIFGDEPQANLDFWNNKASSITVFKYKSAVPEGESGGVQFYTDPNYITLLPLTNIPIRGQKNWVGFGPSGSDQIYSIKIDGDYLVAIAEDEGGRGRCEVFSASDSDLNDNPIGQCILIGTCSPGCWGILGFCPICTGSCASSFRVIPLSW